MNGHEVLSRWCAAAQGLKPSARTVIVVAHPDDEVIGAGGCLAGLRSAYMVHVTDGAPRDMRDAVALGLPTRMAYAQTRRAELLAALDLAGWDTARLHELDMADQETPRALPELTTSLLELFRSVAPEVVLTHPYEGGHPDHDATAFAVHHACHLLRRERKPPPLIVEMTFYHGNAGNRRVGRFLPNGDAGISVRLGVAEAIRKRRMFDCFVTQRTTLAGFPLERERFRVAPPYDFTQAPQTGGLYYEQFPWGLTGAEWRWLARLGRRALGLGTSAVG